MTTLAAGKKIQYAPLPMEVMCRRDLPARAKILAAVLLYYGRTSNGSCRVSLPTLARATGCSERSAHRTLVTLKGAGLITWDNSRGTSTYCFQGPMLLGVEKAGR